MPKFSIIVPIYKVEPYLRECVDSVLAQTYSDYELILVDDGSPDNCGVICEEYAQKDSRIRVVHKKNGGLSDARNAGLDVAVGTYIYFLDGDDSILPNLLETAISEMEAGVDMLVFRFLYDYPDRHTEPGRSLEPREYLLESEIKRMEFIQQILLPVHIGWEAWSRVFRRDLIEQNHLRFEDNRRIFAEDMYFSLCYCAHAKSIVCVKDCLYKYRIRDDSIMGVQKKNNNIGRINELGKAVCRHYSQSEDCRYLEEQFARIHYQIVVGQFLYQLWASGMDPSAFLKMTRESVEDWAFLETCIKETLREKENNICPASYAMELRSHADFLLNGSWRRLRLRCKLIRTFRPVIDGLGKREIIR